MDRFFVLLSDDDVSGVSLFLNGVADVGDVLERGLFVCASCGSWQCLSLLLGRLPAGSVDARDESGATPLVRAVLSDCSSVCVRVLLQHGANVNLPFGEDEQETVLHVAVQRRDVTLVALLVAGGADPTLTNAHGESAFDMCDDDQDLWKELAVAAPAACLWAACERGLPLVVSHCLSSPGPNVCNGRGKTLLMVSCARNHVECAKLLIEAGANVNAKTFKRERTALMYAARRGHVKCVGLLIENGCEITQEHVQIAAEHAHVAKMLQRKLDKNNTKHPKKLKWHRIGHVILLQNISTTATEDLQALGNMYLSLPQCKGARTVALETCSPHGELRQPIVSVIAGDPDTVTCHVEGGVKFWLDPTRIMFSSGNGTERMRWRTHLVDPGEIVVDMFAGIGYFSVPLAMQGRAKRVYAIEKNPESWKFLCKNAEANKVSETMVCLLGDNREVGEVGVASRVFMGYIPTPVQFLPRALEFLNPQNKICYIHYHYTVSTKVDADSVPREHLTPLLGNSHFALGSIETHIVKNYAPHELHCVADIQLLSGTQEKAP